MNNINQIININNSTQGRNENENIKVDNFMSFETKNVGKGKIDIENDYEKCDPEDNLNYIKKYLTTIFDIKKVEEFPSLKEQNIAYTNETDEFKKTMSNFSTICNNLNIDWELNDTYKYETMEKENEENTISYTKTLSIKHDDSMNKDKTLNNENNLNFKKKDANFDGNFLSFLEPEMLNMFHLFNKNDHTNNYSRKNGENLNSQINNGIHVNNDDHFEMKDPFHRDNANKIHLNKIDDNTMKNILFYLNNKNMMENNKNVGIKSVNNANNDQIEQFLKNKNGILNEALNNIENNILDNVTESYNNSNDKYQNFTNEKDKKYDNIDNERIYNAYEKTNNLYSDFSYLDENDNLNYQSNNVHVSDDKKNMEYSTKKSENSNFIKNNANFMEQFQDIFNSGLDYNAFLPRNGSNYMNGDFNDNSMFTISNTNNENLKYNELNENNFFRSNESSIINLSTHHINSNINNSNVNNNNSDIYQKLLLFLTNELNKNKSHNTNNNITKNTNIDSINVDKYIYYNKYDKNNNLHLQNNYNEFCNFTNLNNGNKGKCANSDNENANLKEMKIKDVLEKNNLLIEKNSSKYPLNINLGSYINNNMCKKDNSPSETFNEIEKNNSKIFENLKNKIKVLIENENGGQPLSTCIIDALNDYNNKKNNNSNTIYNDNLKSNNKTENLNKKTNYLSNNIIGNSDTNNLNNEIEKETSNRSMNTFISTDNIILDNTIHDYYVHSKSGAFYNNVDKNNTKETVVNNILFKNDSNANYTHKNIDYNDLKLFFNNDYLLHKNGNQYTNMNSITGQDIESFLDNSDRFSKINDLVNLSNDLMSYNSKKNYQVKFSADEQINNEKSQLLNIPLEYLKNLGKNYSINSCTYNCNNESAFFNKYKNIDEDLKKNDSSFHNQSNNEKNNTCHNINEENNEQIINSSYLQNNISAVYNDNFEEKNLDNTFHSNSIKDKEKDKILGNLKKQYNFEKSNDEYRNNKFQSEKYNTNFNKNNSYSKRKTLLNNKFENGHFLYKKDNFKSKYSWNEKAFNEEEKSNFLASNKESKFIYKNKNSVDKIWTKSNNFKRLYTKTSTKNEETLRDIKSKMKSINSLANLKSKKGSMGKILLSPQELTPLLTEEDEENLEKLLQSLYDDRILPLLFNLKGRAEELQYRDILINNIETVYKLYPEKYLVKKNESAGDYIIYFVNKKVEEDYFLSINNLKDIYDPNIWKQFEQYLEDIAKYEDASLYTFSGGRYGMAKELKNRNLPFFQGLYLGELCHIIHISTNKKLISYENNYLKPISRCHKYTNAKMGIFYADEADIENYIKTMDELKYYLNKLLKYYKGGFNISTLKKKLKNKFNKQICESVFHCIKLIEVLQLDELKDVCVVDKESKTIKSV